MDDAATIALVAKWLPIMWRFVRAVGSDRKKALAEIRRIELEQRAARDRRMGR